LNKKKPDITKVRAAWYRFIEEFLRVEMPDFLEVINVIFDMPNPLAEKKLEVFAGTNGKRVVLLFRTFMILDKRTKFHSCHFQAL
jgi:hypothetical protein